MYDELLLEMEDSFEKTVDHLKKDLTRMRTGRANLSILDGIKVIYYGSPTPLNNVASLNIADPKLISIKPYDKTLIPAIEKAIISADLGLNPNNDGNIIRLPIPPLSGERRKDLVKLVKKQGEDAKVAVRNQRRTYNDKVKSDKSIPEDDQKRLVKKIQDLTNDYVKVISDTISSKEKEILEI